MNVSSIGGSRYVLAVKNLRVSSDFYLNKLNFRTIWEGDGWHFLERDQFKIMLGECADQPAASETGDHSYFAYLEVENIDQLFAELRSKGVAMLSTPENKPWGQREFALRTPDGHRMTFGEPVR